jgi:uncharacterized protein (TIGR02996 family)
MSSFHTVPVPASLVEARRLNLERGIFNHLDWCLSPAGNLHVYSEVSYNARRYKGANDPDDREVEEHDYYSFLVSIYDREYCLLRQVPLDEVGDEVRADVSLDWGSNFTILPGGLCVVTMSFNRCRVYDESLGSCLNAYTVGKEEVRRPEVFYRRGLARQISLCPDGRLLCVLSELNAGIQANLLASSLRPHPDLTGKSQPTLRYLASLEQSDLQREPHPIPYLRLPDAEAFDRTRRPAPSLLDACYQRFGQRVFDPSIHRFIALTADRFLLSVFGRLQSRRSQEYYFLLLDSRGDILGRLLLAEDDSPYDGGQFNAAWDQTRGRIVYKSKTNLYFFCPEGRLLLQVPLVSERLKALQRFYLAAVSPAGDILMQRPDDHTFLAFDPPGDDAQLVSRLADAVGGYDGWKRGLRKQMQWVNKKWISPSSRPPEERPFLQAILADPGDEEARLEFADWLEERGDPLGEFLRNACQLPKLPPGRRRKELERRQQSLWADHGSAWKASLPEPVWAAGAGEPAAGPNR